MTDLFERFKRDTSGATAIEYSLIAGFVALVIIASLTTMGTRLNTRFYKIASSLS